MKACDTAATETRCRESSYNKKTASPSGGAEKQAGNKRFEKGNDEETDSFRKPKGGNPCKPIKEMLENPAVALIL